METTHTVHFQLLKNRMENGTPFLREDAVTRISALANRLELTEQESQTLLALAESKGLDVLPRDAMGRLERVEQSAMDLETATEELTLVMADLIGGGAV